MGNNADCRDAFSKSCIQIPAYVVFGTWPIRGAKLMRIVVLGMLLTWAGPVFAQDEETAAKPDETVSEAPVPEQINGRIVDVQIDGLRRVEEAALMAAVGMRAGDLIAGWKVLRDLIAIYETGFVDDVQVDVSPAKDSNPNDDYPAVVVTFKIAEKPAIRDITISVNKNIFIF